MRGYFGIGVENGKTVANIGTLWRTAVNFGASFTFQIGGRYRKQASDTLASYRKLPHIRYESVADWVAHLPHSCVPVGVELIDGAQDMTLWVHPERACYLLGPEDGSLSKAAQAACAHLVQIPTVYCMNQAITGGVVMYDRMTKRQPA